MSARPSSAIRTRVIACRRSRVRATWEATDPCASSSSFPICPHPPFTGAHTRPLTLLRAAALQHEVAVVGAAPAGRRSEPAAGALRGGAGGAGERSPPGAAARPGRRQAAGHAGPAGERRPLARHRRPRRRDGHLLEARRDGRRDALRGALPRARTSRSSSTCPTSPAASASPRRRRGRSATSPPTCRRRPAAGTSAASSTAPSRSPSTTATGSASPRSAWRPTPCRWRSTCRPRTRCTSAAPAPATTWPSGCSSSARSCTRRTATRPGGSCAASRPNCAPSACRSRSSSPACTRRSGCARPAGAGVTVISDAPDLDPLYRSADIVLAPLPHGGGTKNKTLEAMAWGLPVIGTPQAFTGLPQLDGKAFVVDPLDPLRVAKRIAMLRDEPELRLHLGLAARQYVAAAHAPELAMDRAAALFDAVAAGGGVAQAEALSRERPEADGCARRGAARGRRRRETTPPRDRTRPDRRPHARRRRDRQRDLRARTARRPRGARPAGARRRHRPGRGRRRPPARGAAEPLRRRPPRRSGSWPRPATTTPASSTPPTRRRSRPPPPPWSPSTTSRSCGTRSGSRCATAWCSTPACARR